MTAPARIKQDDVTRIMRGARNAGFERVQVRIDVHGNIVVDACNDASALPIPQQNPLDRILGGR